VFDIVRSPFVLWDRLAGVLAVVEGYAIEGGLSSFDAFNHGRSVCTAGRPSSS
jgi:hypothetical protein